MRSSWKVGTVVEIEDLPRKKGEVWKNISVEGFESVYAVSNMGRVARLVSSRKAPAGFILTPYASGNAGRKSHYRRVNLNFEGRKKLGVALHRLVALAFVRTPEGKESDSLTVNHVDGDKDNNRASNLAWTTNEENVRHGFRTGLIDNTGSNHGRAKVDEDDVREIRELRESGMVYREIGERYGLDRTTVGQICRREKWQHVE